MYGWNIYLHENPWFFSAIHAGKCFTIPTVAYGMYGWKIVFPVKSSLLHVERWCFQGVFFIYGKPHDPKSQPFTQLACIWGHLEAKLLEQSSIPTFHGNWLVLRDPSTGLLYTLYFTLFKKKGSVVRVSKASLLSETFITSLIIVIAIEWGLFVLRLMTCKT